MTTANYIYEPKAVSFSAPTGQLTINHKLNRYPGVDVYDSNDEKVICEVVHTDADNTVLSFYQKGALVAFSGRYVLI